MALDMAAVLAEAEAYLNSSAGKARVNQSVREDLQQVATEAASKFIGVLRSAIAGSGLSAGAIEAISNLDYGSPYALGDGTSIISVYFDDDLSRPSLDEARYGGIDDLAMLFNEGVDHTMRPVHGTWHDADMWSRTVIPGSHFLEQAVTDFMGNYGSEYNVIDIQINK